MKAESSIFLRVPYLILHNISNGDKRVREWTDLPEEEGVGWHSRTLHAQAVTAHGIKHSKAGVPFWLVVGLRNGCGMSITRD